MSEEQGTGSPSPKAEFPGLRFSCPHCQLELTAPLSAAAVVGPCPSCGEQIQAPPVPSGEARRKSDAPTPEGLPPRVRTMLPAAKEEVRVKKSASGEVRVERRVRKRRSESSGEGKVESPFEAEERRETMALLKLVLAVFATLVITLVVCWLVWEGIMESPVPGAP